MTLLAPERGKQKKGRGQVGGSCTECKTRRSETYLGNLMKYQKCLKQAGEITAVNYSETDYKDRYQRSSLALVTLTGNEECGNTK